MLPPPKNGTNSSPTDELATNRLERLTALLLELLALPPGFAIDHMRLAATPVGDAPDAPLRIPLVWPHRPATCGLPNCCGQIARSAEASWVADTAERVLRHLPVGGRATELAIRVPYVRCYGGRTSAKQRVEPPIADPHARISRPLVVAVQRHLHERGPADAARLSALSQDTVRDILQDYRVVAEEGITLVPAPVLGLDELYLRRVRTIITGLEHIPGSVDIRHRRHVIDILPDKRPATIRAALRRLAETGKPVEKICVDFDRTYTKYAEEACKLYWPQAEIVYDCFHSIGILLQAIAKHLRKVRKTKNSRFLQGAGPLLAKKRHKLNESEIERMLEFEKEYSGFISLFFFKEDFRGIFQQRDATAAADEFDRLLTMARDNRLLAEVFGDALAWIGGRLPAVLGYFRGGYTAGFTESMVRAVREIWEEGRGWADTPQSWATFRAQVLLRHGQWTAETMQALVAEQWDASPAATTFRRQMGEPDA